MSKKLFFNILKFAVFLSIGCLLIWLITKDLTAEQKVQIKLSFQNANYWWVVLSVCIGIISHILRTLRWKMMLEPLGYNARTHVTFCSVMIAYLANLAIPRLGEITRCGIMQRYEKVPFDKALGTIVVERALDLFSFFLVTAFALIIQFSIVSGFFNEKVIIPLSQKFSSNSSLIIILIISFFFLIAAGIFVFRKFKHTEIFLRIKIMMMNIRDGIYSIRHLKNLPVFILYSVAIWFCYYAMIWVCFYALPQTSIFGFKEGLAILVFGTLGIISTPGGIGSYQLLISLLLSSVYGLDYGISYAFSWILWTGQTLMIISIGFLSLVFLPLIANKKQKLYDAHGNSK